MNNNKSSDVFLSLLTHTKIFLVVMMILAISSSYASAQIIDVPPGNTGALIDAINQANINPDAAVINLGGGTYTLTVVDNSANGDNGLPSITTDITFNGNGSIVERSTSPGTPPFRIFHIGGDQSSTHTVTFNDLTIRNGVSTSNGGGGLLNITLATVNINDCVVSDNIRQGGQSAGINNDFHGTMNIYRTTITRNLHDGSGAGVGGIINDWNGVLNIFDSTISDNVGPRGGGVGNNSGGIINMINTTVSGNINTRTNDASAGGVYNNSRGDIFIDSSTITNNEGQIAGNVGNNSSGSIYIINTIVGESIDGPSCRDDDGLGLIVSEGYNIDQGASCGFNSVGDKSFTNPRLGELQDNGGPTETHLPFNGSPAIDMGKIPCPPPDTDQRGVQRPFGNRCDIGAVEVGAKNVPTLSEWGLIAMAGILGIVGFMVIRRKQVSA